MTSNACIVCATTTHGGREHCSACSPSFGPYDVVTSFMFKADADAFVATEVKKLTSFPWCMVALNPSEAERITRKNAVAHAFNMDDEHGHRAARLFEMEKP